MRSGDDRQVCHRLLQRSCILASRAIISGKLIPPIPWPMTVTSPPFQAKVGPVKAAAGLATVAAVGVTLEEPNRGDLFFKLTSTRRSLLLRTSITPTKCSTPSSHRPIRVSTGSSGTLAKNMAPVLLAARGPTRTWTMCLNLLLLSPLPCRQFLCLLM